MKLYRYILPYRTKQCRAKFFVGQNFRHHRKISALLSDEKFCPFLIFLISFKHQLVIIYSVKINVINKTLYPE